MSTISCISSDSYYTVYLPFLTRSVSHVMFVFLSVIRFLLAQSVSTATAWFLLPCYAHPEFCPSSVLSIQCCVQPVISTVNCVGQSAWVSLDPPCVCLCCDSDHVCCSTIGCVFCVGQKVSRPILCSVGKVTVTEPALFWVTADGHRHTLTKLTILNSYFSFCRPVQTITLIVVNLIILLLYCVVNLVLLSYSYFLLEP